MKPGYPQGLRRVGSAARDRSGHASAKPRPVGGSTRDPSVRAKPGPARRRVETGPALPSAYPQRPEPTQCGAPADGGFNRGSAGGGPASPGGGWRSRARIEVSGDWSVATDLAVTSMEPWPTGVAVSAPVRAATRFRQRPEGCVKSAGTCEGWRSSACSQRGPAYVDSVETMLRGSYNFPWRCSPERQGPSVCRWCARTATWLQRLKSLDSPVINHA